MDRHAIEVHRDGEPPADTRRRAGVAALLVAAAALVGCGDDASAPMGAAGSGAAAASGAGGNGPGAGGGGGSSSGVGAGGSDLAVYPEEILCPEAPHDDPRCGPAYDPGAPLGEAVLAAALDDGLQAWRYPGTGGACASCHAPGALDLAKIGFSDEDIRRRALDHLDEERAATIVAFAHAMRQKLGLTRLLHPDLYRPLQPTHVPLHATTPGLDVNGSQAQAERDEAFMRVLTDERALLWATGSIRSLAEAQQAHEELLAIDLRHLPLGIPFDRLSEDAALDEARMSVFEWFPAIPSTPTDDRAGDYYGLVDAYLASPTDERLWAFVDAIDTHTACDYDLGGEGDPLFYQRACDWMRLKYRSLQVLQHMLRHDTAAYPDVLAGQPPGITVIDALPLVIHRHPIWEAGDFVRVAPLQRPPETACFEGDNQPCTLLPPAIDETIHNQPSYVQARIQQSEIFQQSWFVMSWLRDPALLHQGDSFATFIGDYLESVLLPYYDVHHAFVVAKMAVEKSAAAAWLDAGGFRAGTGKIASVRTFSFKQLRDNFSPPPEADPRYGAHLRMFANFARMWLYLVDHDLGESGTVFGRDDVLYATRFMRTWIERLEGAEDPDINAVMLSIEQQASEATELRSQQNAEQTPGLQPDDRWEEFADPYTG